MPEELLKDWYGKIRSGFDYNYNACLFCRAQPGLGTTFEKEKSRNRAQAFFRNSKANRANLFAEVESSIESADDSAVAASSVVTFCGKIKCGLQTISGAKS